tara:strand:- start:168 stop:605 length:438 start_codon:yes stop_codon:yes gene_type:complete
MSNSITPVRGTITNPFGSIFSDRFFDSFFSDAPIYGVSRSNRRDTGFSPRFNVQQSETGYVISVAAPGVSKEDVNVNIEDNTLTISYTQEENTETSFACSSFRRSWRLPEGTDIENITAAYENGILSLSVPTADAKTYTRTIEVK